MYKEKVAMTNEEMFTALIARMDSMESGLNKRLDRLESRMDGLETRMDSLETRVERLEVRIDKLESDMNMEFQAVRIEMDVVNKSLKKDISILNDKIDRLMYIKDVDGYEKMKIQVNLLTQGYQELKERYS